MATLTKTKIRALRWLADHKGCARLDSYGRIADRFDVLSPHSSATYFRLMLSGHCCAHPLDDHIAITMKGMEAIRKDGA